MSLGISSSSTCEDAKRLEERYGMKEVEAKENKDIESPANVTTLLLKQILIVTDSNRWSGDRRATIW